MYWFPKTKIGKISFWVGVSAFVLVYAQYWLAMLFQASSPILLGIITMICVCVSGVTSIVALTKYRDRAILLFLSAAIGAMGILFVLGEFLFPH